MTAEEFYTKYVNRLDIQLKYNNKDKRGLLFEVMEKYSEYKNSLQLYITLRVTTVALFKH